MLFLKKLVIFDLDGTLLNTLSDIHFSINYALEKLNLPKITLSEVRDHVCNGLNYLVTYACKKEILVPVVTKLYSEISVDYAYKTTTPYKGIMELLEELKKRNINLAILSNKRCWQTEILYERFFAKFDFLAVYGNSLDYPLKPDPTLLLKILKEFKYTKEEVVLVGDGDTDVLTAKNAGIDFVGVTWGYCDKEVLEKVGAKKFINFPLELFNYI